ncbi:receptor protein kinase-like protein [Trifolium pratense]|uniref:Receptor protein kinase-like protein n=1 Tax=Trifolium pratense TaxID=57577 RepID=A0A2K3JRH6_TRIPR|nr:receptor protein kinase-like protein [Trifolium pratense]
MVGTESSTLTSQLEMEANAILNSRWWNTSDANYNISNRCSWGQISCNKAGSIIKINIDQHLKAAWESEFATLNLSIFHNLESLGEIPPSLGSLRHLKHLDISHNYLQGFIPHELGFLKNLTTLDLSQNKIKGKMPHSLGNLTKLTHLVMCNNFNLVGEIPPSLGNLTQLTYLDLSGNYFEGEGS